MHPRQLKTFLSVTRHGNVTRAAAEVNLAQSSVSDQIQALEAEAGALLFVRSRQGLQLTEAGRALLPYAEEIVALDDEARAAVRQAMGNASRMVVIGALETIASGRLAGWLPEFGASHPDITVKLAIGSTGELLRQLEDGKLDAAFLFDRGTRDKRFSSRSIGAEPMVLIGPPSGSPATAPSLQSLAGAAFIATERGCIYRHLFENAFAGAGLDVPKPAAEVGSTGTIVRMVAKGAGLALIPRLAASDALRRGEVTELAWPGATANASLLLVWRRRRIQPSAVTVFVDFASSRHPALRSNGDRLPHAVPSLS